MYLQNGPPPSVPSLRDLEPEEPIDTERYLTRIGIQKDELPADPYRLLCLLHRKHAETFPFENIDVALGRPVDVSLEAISEKLLNQRRGGHCVELNLLFAAVLGLFGYTITHHAARVTLKNKDAPRSHAILFVHFGGEVWLADTAFTPGILEPLPLRDSAEANQGGRTYTLVRETDDHWTLKETEPRQRELYRFGEEVLNWADLEMIATWGAYSHYSPIIGDLFVSRRSCAAQVTLHGTELKRSDPRSASSVVHLRPAEIPGVLRNEFDIELAPSETRALIRSLTADGKQKLPQVAAKGKQDE